MTKTLRILSTVCIAAAVLIPSAAYALGDSEISKNSDSYWNEKSVEYDKVIHEWVKDYDLLIKNIVNSIPYNENDSIRVLDLGSGTGNVSVAVSEKFKNADFCCVDISDVALDVCKERLKNNNVSIVKSDIRNPEIFKENSYDLVVSNLAIHHIEDNEKEELYTLINNALKKNGYVVVGETMKYEDSKVAKNFGVAQFEEHESHPCSLFKQFKILENSGFDNIDCAWKTLNFGVFCARKI